MNAEHFNFFWKASKEMAIVRKIKPEAIDSTLGGISYDGIIFDNAIADTLSKVKIFEIDDNIKKLLALTDAPKINDDEYIHLPFSNIFLDVQFTREELEDYGINPIYANLVRGIAVTRGNFIYREEDGIKKDLRLDVVGASKTFKGFVIDEGVGDALRITMCSVIDRSIDEVPKTIRLKDITYANEDKNDRAEEEILFDVFNKNVNLSDEYKDKAVDVLETPTSDPELRDFVHKFILNFLNFLHNPEVEYVEHKRSEGNIQRKMKQGKPIIPSTMTIKLNGKIKEYIDYIGSQGLWHYEHRFWVRGHYRDLKDERYKEKKRIWIFPFLKGRGQFVDKDYILTNDN